ncbi:MAG TPA: ABC transporter ATP-binding protein, partial [Candidatus Binatus sp.]|nr:ABC transporter ATP-binding protein [Candidatus Binatus sp.]
MTAIQSSSLVKVYRRSKTPALNHVTLTVGNGQIFTLLGRNGAGKTTFLRIAATQLLLTDGKVEVFGSDVVTEASRIRERVAVVPQEGNTVGPLTPWDHVYLTLLARGMSRGDAKDRTHKVLGQLELTSIQTKPADTLSGGLRQRVRVAMAVAADADLLFLDEPTLGLDAISRRRIWTVLKDIAREGRTILLTTHYIEEAEILSDNVAVINTGSVVTSGSPRELLGKVEERVRVDVTGKFTEEELAPYGRPVRIAERWRVLTDNKRSGELTVEAVRRGCEVSVAPVSLEDLFVDLVGTEEEETEEAA